MSCLSLNHMKQQRLPAWHPLLFPRTISLWLAGIGVMLLVLAMVVTSACSKIRDFEVRYDDVSHCTVRKNHGSFTYSGNGMTWSTGCITNVSFTIEHEMRAPVYLFYGLTNFFQSHRRFSHSISPRQLRGQVVKPGHDLEGTSPLTHPGELHHTTRTLVRLQDGSVRHYDDFVYAPAGIIPWSMFNDSFVLFQEHTIADAAEEKDASTTDLICDGKRFSRSTNEPLDGVNLPTNSCHKKGIAWTSDVRQLYKPVYLDSHVWSADPEGYVDYRGHPHRPPRQGLNPAPSASRSNDTFLNNGWYANELGHQIPYSTDEDFIVWARVSASPNFRKLYRVIDVDLPPGSYVMSIHEHFDVSSFKGMKYFALTTESWLGGVNHFVRDALWITGLGAVGFAFVFGAISLKQGHRPYRALGQLRVD